MKIDFLAIALGTALTASSTSLVAQDTTTSQIVVTGKYKKDWEKGSKLEAEGLAALEKARKDLVKYSADVVDAQNKRDSSAARGGNSEAEFRRLLSESHSFASAEEAAQWAGKVDKAAANWARYEKRGADGREALDKAIKRQREAQEKVDSAQENVDRGRALMTEAEASSRSSTN